MMEKSNLLRRPPDILKHPASISPQYLPTFRKNPILAGQAFREQQHTIQKCFYLYNSAVPYELQHIGIFYSRTLILPRIRWP